MKLMVWSTSNIPDQSGRIVLVTGANSGLGFETARTLLAKGATVIMGCRSRNKAITAKKKLLMEVNTGSVELLDLELSDLRQVKRAVGEVNSKYDRLDLLVNNAGLMAPPYTLSKQGFEIQFAVNHLSHMMLTLMLLPLLSQRAESRVVTVSSGAQYMGKINWDDLQGVKNYDRWAAYSQSKLANVMFALELDKRFRKTGKRLSSLVAHPGIARTNLQSTSMSVNNSWQESLLYKLMNPLFQSASMGALPQLLAATNPNAQSGEQYGPRFNFRGYPKLCRIAPLALNSHERKKLWAFSESLIESYRN